MPLLDPQKLKSKKKQSGHAVEVAETDLHVQVGLLEELVTL